MKPQTQMMLRMRSSTPQTPQTFASHYHETRTIDVELFTWEKLDSVDNIRKAFDLK